MRPPDLNAAIQWPFPSAVPQETASEDLRIEQRVLTLFDECGPGLRRYVGSFSLGRGTTEDIVQDVFLALFRHLSLRRPDHNLHGWLFQVAHNLAVKQQQRTRRRGALEHVWDARIVERVHDETPNPEQQLATSERQRHLGYVLLTMPDRDRRCLYLRAEGLCYRDIAKALGISLGSVAKSVVRAMTRLTTADQEYHDAGA